MHRPLLWHISYILFPSLVLLHLFISPYTKVEESFNIQAVHDILKYGVPTHNVYLKFKALYDHMTFPGAVPRTFIGALVLASIAKPVVWYGNLTEEQQQFLVRAILGLFNAASLITYASGVRRAHGKTAAGWYAILQASQFHIWYYSSRTLPNMFASGMSTFALSFLLPDPSNAESRIKRTKLSLYLLTLSTIIFRSELALLLASHCFYLVAKSSSLSSTIRLIRNVFIPAILSATVAGLLVTVPIDTYFWQSRTWLWPELAAFLSNVLPSKDSLGASAWGTSPWHWYFTSALPRLLVNPLLVLLIPWSLSTTLAPSVLDLLIPNLGYVALYSILPHKETRFLFPVVPPLTASLAICASYISTHRSRSTTYTLVNYTLISTTILSGILSHGLLLPLSSLTYPGAHALSALHTVSLAYPSQPTLRIHLTNLALQTGVTHFLSHPSSARHDRPVFTLPGSPSGHKPTIVSTRRTKWVYDKSDNETEFLTPTFWAQFDYVVVEDPGRVIGRWDVVEKVPALGKLRVLTPDVGRGLLVLGPKEGRREDDGLSRMVGEVYGNWAKWLYGLLHDLVREGHGVGGVLGKNWSWTRGWWVHWGLENKLYVLKRAEKQW